MLRNYFLINLLLVFIIVLLGIRLHAALTTAIEISTKATIVSPRKIEKKPKNKISHIDSLSYDVIASKNLFHPSRSIKKALPEVSKPVSDIKIPQLFGTIIMNDKKLAILEDQSTNKSNLYTVNDSVSGFIVSQILDNKVILQKGGESIEVTLRADKKYKQPKRSQARKKSVRKTPTRRRRPRRVRRNTPNVKRPAARKSRGR